MTEKKHVFEQELNINVCDTLPDAWTKNQKAIDFFKGRETSLPTVFSGRYDIDWREGSTPTVTVSLTGSRSAYQRQEAAPRGGLEKAWAWMKKKLSQADNP